MIFVLVMLIAVSILIYVLTRNEQTHNRRADLIDNFYENLEEVRSKIFNSNNEVAIEKLAKKCFNFDDYHISYNEQMLKPWKNPIKKPYPRLEDYL